MGKTTATRCPICEGSGVIGSEREMVEKIADAFKKHGKEMSVDQVIEQLQLTDAARYVGRLGAQKGGLARSAKLSPDRRREIASSAARARWSRHVSAPTTREGGGA